MTVTKDLPPDSEVSSHSRMTERQEESIGDPGFNDEVYVQVMLSNAIVRPLWAI